jgi:hypothetical protein
MDHPLGHPWQVEIAWAVVAREEFVVVEEEYLLEASEAASRKVQQLEVGRALQ